MAFLDNSGDIILDAVLTDTGRFRMARGDFKITKFALGDDEIDYTLYNRSHPSGSSYYDLEVLKTPVLEAFTNNTSMLKSKLLTITNTNLLFLPVLKLSDGGYNGTAATRRTTKLNNGNNYIVTVDANTEHSTKSLVTGDGNAASAPTGTGIIFGGGRADNPNFVMVEHGLDTVRMTPKIALPASMQENQFIIEMDDRLGHLVDKNGNQVPVSFIDDDQIASYYISANAGADVNGLITGPEDTIRGDGNDEGDNGTPTAHVIRGPRGNRLQFSIRPSVNLTNSSYLFGKLGSQLTQTANNTPVHGFQNAKVYDYIDTFVRVTAATTAYSIDVPVRYLKNVGTA